MATAKNHSPRFVVCLRNEGYEAALERNKIYVLLRDLAADREGMIRVVDESGQGYLYPAAWFAAVVLPPRVGRAVAEQR